MSYETSGRQGLLSKEDSLMVGMFPTRTWYVNGQTGDDTNTGLSESAPFKSMTKLFEVLRHGDSVYMYYLSLADFEFRKVQHIPSCGICKPQFYFNQCELPSHSLFAAKQGATQEHEQLYKEYWKKRNS